MDGKRYTTNTHVFLNLKFLESYELGATSLQIQSTTRLVSDTVLTGTRQQRHELRRGDLQQTISQRVLTTNCTAEGGEGGAPSFSAATSRRHCFSHRTLHMVFGCVTDCNCNL